MPRSSKIVVLGAGPSGLSIGWGLAGKTDVDVTVLEASSFPGGLSRTLERDGIRFDIGPHRLSPQIPEVVEAVEGLLGDGLLRKENLHAVYFGGHLYNYPPRLTDFFNLYSLKSTAVFGASWAAARLRSLFETDPGTGRDRSFEETLVRAFGRSFCRTVIFPMISKVWGTRDLHPEFARIRFDLPTFTSVLKKIFVKGSGFNDRYFYYPEKGFGHIWDTLSRYLVDAGQRIEFGARIESIEAESLGGPFRVNYTQDGDSRSVEADVLASTISNSALIGYMEGTGLLGPVLHMRRRFNTRTMRLGVILVEGFHLPTRVIIFPEERYLFNRISEMNMFSDLGYPAGTAVLMVDVICDSKSEYATMDDGVFDGRLLEEVLGLGWFGENDIRKVFSVVVPEAYPVLDQQRYEAQEELTSFFSKSSVVLCGREASSDYNNAHNAIYKSFLAARYICGEIGYEEYENSSRMIGRLPIQD